VQRTRCPQVEAGMVPADTPGRAVAVQWGPSAFVVEVGAELVPELVTSTLSSSRIAIVAGPAGQRGSR
jgi:hypothetical protein